MVNPNGIRQHLCKQYDVIVVRKPRAITKGISTSSLKIIPLSDFEFDHYCGKYLNVLRQPYKFNQRCGFEFCRR